MKEKKVLNIPVFATLVVLSIIATVGVASTISAYLSNAHTSDLMSAKDTQIARLSDQVSGLKLEISTLQQELNNFSSAKLVTIGMEYSDNRSTPNAPFVQVSGYICNVGNSNATNAKINILAYQTGNVIATNRTATIETLEPGAWATVNLQIPYSGDPLQTYSATLKWTG